MLAALVVAGSAAAEPSVVVSDEGVALLCWEDERSLVPVLGVGHSGSEAEVSKWDAARLVSVTPLVAVAPVVEVEAPTAVRVVAWQGRVNRSDCDVSQEDSASPEQEGVERAVSFLPAASEPYRSSIRKALGAPSAQVLHLVRLDLDGDGMAEVVFAGSYASAPSSAMLKLYEDAGETPPEHAVTSFVGVSLASGGGRPSVRILSRREDSPRAHGMPGTFIAGVTDVGGDGSLELVIGLRGDHWAGYDFVRFERSSIRSTVSTDLYW